MQTTPPDTQLLTAATTETGALSAKPVVSMCFSLILALGKPAAGDTPDLMDFRNSFTVSRLHEEAPTRTLH